MLFGLFVIHLHANSDNNSLHTFNSGETISSNKVNQNFVLASNYVVKANGQIVGDLISVNNTALIIITSKGYLTEIDVITGQIKQGYISHTNDTCTLVDGNYYVNPQLYKQIMKYSLSNGNDNMPITSYPSI